MDKELTQEAYFLKPFIEINNKNFVNIFSVNQNKPYLDKNYFILHDHANAIVLHELITFYKVQPGFIRYESYKINGVFYSCFIFQPTDTLTHHYELFKTNNHGKLSDNIKKLITSYWNKNGVTYNIFNTTFKESYIPHSDYIEDITDELFKQFTDYETKISILDVEYDT